MRIFPPAGPSPPSDMLAIIPSNMMFWWHPNWPNIGFICLCYAEKSLGANRPRMIHVMFEHALELFKCVLGGHDLEDEKEEREWSAE